MLRIGDFSRLALLSVRVLRHYDEIGLLRPAWTDPSSGYRYYTADQLADVHRVVALKNLGLSLEQVQALLKDGMSAEEVTGVLRLERARAAQDLAAARRRVTDLTQLLARIGEAGALDDAGIVEKPVPALPYLALRTRLRDLHAAEALIEEITAAGRRLTTPGPLLIVAHGVFVDPDDLDLELGFAVSEPRLLDLGAGRVLTARTLPAVDRMISTILRADHEDGHRHAQQSVAAWLQGHNCRLAGPGREIIYPAETDQSAAVEIQYPVTTAD